MSPRKAGMAKASRAVLLVAGLALLGCSGPEAPRTPPAQETAQAVKVSDIDVGRALAPDKTIAERTDTFRPDDTLYVAVKTVGASPSAVLAAHWTYGDQEVTQSSQTIAPSGPAVTEFHVSKPAGGSWPTGEYKVEILLNGVSAGAEMFKVK
jgi:hypothetical protein